MNGRDIADNILRKHIDKEQIDHLSKNVWDDILDAMIEYKER